MLTLDKPSKLRFDVMYGTKTSELVHKMMLNTDTVHKHYVKKILVFTGLSDSGKDTCAEYLYSIRRFPILKFVECSKNYVEDALCLPRGFLNDKKKRESKVVCPITGDLEEFTYVELLVKMYHERLNSYPKLTLPYTGKQIDDAWTSVSITDMRSPLEAQYLMRNFANDVIHIRISGRGYERTSDACLTYNEAYLPVKHTVDNSKSFFDTQRQLNDILTLENI